MNPDPSFLGDGGTLCRAACFPPTPPYPSETRDRRSWAIPAARRLPEKPPVRPETASEPRSQAATRPIRPLRPLLGPARSLIHQPTPLAQVGATMRGPDLGLDRASAASTTSRRWSVSSATQSRNATGASRCLGSALPFAGRFLMLRSAAREDGGPEPMGLGSPSTARQSDEPAVGEQVLPRPRRGALNRLPARIAGSGATPRGRGQGCDNTPAPEPVPGPRTGGSLPPRPEPLVRHGLPSNRAARRCRSAG